MLINGVLQVSEEALQNQIQDYLKLKFKGLRVLATNKAKARVICDKGVPDLIVTHDSWPGSMWIGLEVKTPIGRLSKEQTELHEAGRITVVRSLDDAEEAVCKFIALMGGDPEIKLPRLSSVDFKSLVLKVAKTSRALMGCDFEKHLATCLRRELEVRGVSVEAAKP